MKKFGLLSVLALSASAVAATHAGRAEACGGCFIPPSPNPDATVVTDHRMALSISPQQTILWDQIRYSGDPREFAWVLPVRPGAKIELANDELFGALDASTQPTVYPPQSLNTFGCGLTGCADNAGDSLSSAGSAGNGGGVSVISQSVVGPYDQATLRATDDGALVSWLRQNQFFLPTAIEPTVAAYVSEGFDFIALKLRPECGQRSMKPVRVVSPGAVPSLPLRMVAAGVGPKVGITLYVITEGKYQPQNFPHVEIPDEKLRWDRYTNKSNYELISQDLMAQANGKTWIIEYADKPQLPTGTGWQDPSSFPVQYSTNTATRSNNNSGLAQTYFSLCKAYSASVYNPYNPYSPSSSSSSSGTINVTPCPEADAGLSGRDSGVSVSVSDAGGGIDSGDDQDDDGGGVDAGDAGDQQQDDDDDNGQTSSSGFSSSGYSSSGYSSSSSGGLTPAPSLDVQCAYLDDLDAALVGLHSGDVWVTRMRSLLPANALSEGDLLVEPVKLADGRADPDTVSNVHWTPYYADDDLSDNDVKSNCAGSPRHYHRPYASYTALAIFGAAVAITLGRRKRRPKK